jgi:Sulfotransferase family
MRQAGGRLVTTPVESYHPARRDPGAGGSGELCYVLSPSYSGSTLLTFLLGTHPDVATIGELKASGFGDIEQYDCSCGVRLRQCPFWTRVVDELTAQGMPLDLADFGTHFHCPARPWLDRLLRSRVRGGVFETARSLALRLIPDARRAHRAILDRNRVFVEVLSQLEKAPVFVDSSKEAVRLKYLVEAGHWAIRAIYLVRDGRGTAASYMRHTRTSMAVAADEWRRTIEECDRVIGSLPERARVKVHYEALCRDPDETLARLFRFLGLDPCRATRDFRSVEQHILGNAMRLGSSSEITLDERWRTSIEPGDLTTFERIAGRLNRAHGYVD